MTALTPKERLQACLTDDSALDRAPVALWRHFPGDDQTPEELATATLHWQATYNWDLVKVTPASSFCLRDWGVEDAWEGHPEGTRRYTKRVIRTASDWEKLVPLPPNAPHLAAQLKALALIRQSLDPQIPLVQTIFSPLAQAKNLAGGENLILHLRHNPQAVIKGLETITKSTRDFIEAARYTGIDGIFYAVQHAQASLLSYDEFETFGAPFDRETLAAADGLWLNMLHLHGLDVYFDSLTDYPAQVINWHDRETAPTLAEARPRTAQTLCGGMKRETVALGTPEQIRVEIADALAQTGGRRFILGTGCVVETIAPHGNLLTVRQAVERI
jgi:uroporphyrinogen decarboxylase